MRELPRRGAAAELQVGADQHAAWAKQVTHLCDGCWRRLKSVKEREVIARFQLAQYFVKLPLVHGNAMRQTMPGNLFTCQRHMRGIALNRIHPRQCAALRQTAGGITERCTQLQHALRLLPARQGR